MSVDLEGRSGPAGAHTGLQWLHTMNIEQERTTRQTSEQLFDALSQRDAQRLSSLYLPDATFADPVLGELPRGAVRSMWSAFLGCQPDWNFDPGPDCNVDPGLMRVLRVASRVCPNSWQRVG